MRKTLILTCTTCNKEFDKCLSEYKRGTKEGKIEWYCCLSCASKKLIYRNIPPGIRADYNNRLNRSGSVSDEYSPFRWHLRNCRRRKKEGFDLTLEYLKDLWDEQGGICPYTGWQILNLKNSSPVNQLPITPDRASVDRIDSSKGYIQGNVQFISLMAQYAKNIFSEDDVVRFCKSVAEYRKK